MTKITEEIQELFKKCRYHLGAPVMEVELTDEQLCVELEMAVEDYAERVQNWIIENQWATLYGKDLNNIDLAYALSVRTLDLSKDFSYWFSKEVGLQQRGPWELKKDFIKIECGKQNYLIPAGREINGVLYCNPPSTPAAINANYGGIDMLGFAGGYGQVGGGGSYGPMGGFYIAQSCDIAYMATDLTYKTRLLRGDLTYKVTGGPDGTHILHLYSTPGSKYNFGHGNLLGYYNMVGCEVWYTYYDTTADNVDECRRMNNGVILTPDQVPLSKIDYAFLNEPTKVLVRKLFFSKAKNLLARIRGKFSGRISIMEAEANLDYNMLLNQAKDEYTEAMDDLNKRLERMSPLNVLKNNAEMMDSMAKILAGKPMKTITV